jgi:hypothetical protein
LKFNEFIEAEILPHKWNDGMMEWWNIGMLILIFIGVSHLFTFLSRGSP